jgi:hypothetical protein
MTKNEKIPAHQVKPYLERRGTGEKNPYRSARWD